MPPANLETAHSLCRFLTERGYYRARRRQPTGLTEGVLRESYYSLSHDTEASFGVVTAPSKRAPKMKNKWERARRAGLQPRAPFYFAFRAVLFRFSRRSISLLSIPSSVFFSLFRCRRSGAFSCAPRARRRAMTAPWRRCLPRPPPRRGGSCNNSDCDNSPSLSRNVFSFPSDLPSFALDLRRGIGRR